MTSTTTLDIEQQPLPDFAEKAYLNYAMYVILDRALPHLADGLKPVQRRIIYAMSELGLSAQAKYKKSARTIGDVLGKFHPHGDAACYEAMVLMAQSFSYRYPFVDGQGNWGSADDPKSFAAMRYTESRLSPYTELLLAELHQGTVDWQPNFDSTLEEPRLLPARIPNILLNGSTGIAVGMATDIPPHNITEILTACMLLLTKPNTTLAEICDIIQGPDYPTCAEIITPRAEIFEMYERGTGSVKQRAVYQIENQDIVVTELPFQVAGAKVLEQIAAQMHAKKLPMLADLRDESDQENPTRLVITLRSNRVEIEPLMAHLFATTDLERSYRINLNMIGTNGKPQVKNLLQILTEWLAWRTMTVQRRLQHRLDQIDRRLHLLMGLLIVYLNLDEVIAIIRREDEPKPILMKRFQLSELQADAILDTKLRHLAKLEEMKIREEQNKLAKEKAQIEKMLGSDTLLKKLVHDELAQDLDQFGDARRSVLVTRKESQAMSLLEQLPNEPVTVILSEKDWIRVAKGHEARGESLSYRAGDQFKMIARGRSLQPLLLLDSTGRSYSLSVHQLPSARSQGEPLSGHLAPPPQAHFVGALFANDEQPLLLCANQGYGFITTASQLICKNKKGKALLNVAPHQALAPILLDSIDNDLIALVSSEGYLLIIAATDIPQLNKGKGNKLIQIPKNKSILLTCVIAFKSTQTLTLNIGKRTLTLKPKDWEHYKSDRAKRGKSLPKGLTQVQSITAE